ncbi:MAG: hypothetical protein FJ222_06715 [Lentisphaerae bacterium]|nr:hypothetical protein [Lentisphaerota bacterium]
MRITLITVCYNSVPVIRTAMESVFAQTWTEIEYLVKSTKGWRSNLLLNREIVRGNRENGVYTNLAMLMPKYAFKVWEFWGRKS